MPYRVTVSAPFTASHAVTMPDGVVEKLHNHRWDVEVLLKTGELDEKGFLRDFLEIREHLQKTVPEGENLNERFGFNPTAENLARWFYETLKPALPQLAEVTVTEAPGCRATYHR